MSSQVVGARLVLASGDVLALDARARAGAAGRGAQVSLGLLGVFSELRLQLVPAYRLHERIWRTGIEECLAELERDVAATRHYEFWWYPHKDYAEQKALAPTEAPAESVAGRKGERIDWSARVLPSVRELRFNEMEYSVPAAAGPPASAPCASACSRAGPTSVWPVEYRTLAGDDAWLSTAHARDTVTISLHQDARAPVRSVLRRLRVDLHARTAGGRTGASCTRAAPATWRRSTRCGSASARCAASSTRSGTFANAYLRELFEID